MTPGGAPTTAATAAAMPLAGRNAGCRASPQCCQERRTSSVTCWSQSQPFSVSVCPGRMVLTRTPLLFSGVQILSPRLFKDAPTGKFSLNVLYDRALEEGRLFGIVHDGRWFHVGTPEALPEVSALLSAERSE